MSMLKHFGVIAMSAALSMGCGPDQPEDTDQLRQKGGFWTPGNSGTDFPARAGNLVSRGARKVITSSGATVWYLMTIDLATGATNDAAAVIDSITYNGLSVTNLSTTQGWFLVTTNTTGGPTTTTVQGSGFTLDFHISSPVDGTLRLSHSDDGASYGKYDAHFLADVAGSSWQPYCYHWWTDGSGTAEAIAEPFIPVAGAKWLKNGSRVDDSAAISFGCMNDAIGSCVDWGYAPWDSATVWSGWPPQASQVSLKDTHQACTRMKRADFCGNGTGNTSEFASPTIATNIQVWDKFNIHSMSPQTRSTMEAYWDPNGATCVNPTRLRAHSQYYTDAMSYQLTNVCPGKPTCSGTTTTGLTGSGRPCYQDAITQVWTCP